MSRLGLFLFYYAKIHGALYFNLPGAILVLAILRNAIGVGAFPPIRAVLKAVWITVRLFFDFATDADRSLGTWFWAFSISVLWPLYAGIEYSFRDPLDSPRVSVIANGFPRQSTRQALSISACGSASPTASSASSKHSHRKKGVASFSAQF